MSGAGQVQAVGVTNFACALPQCSPPPTQVTFFQTWVSCLTLAQRCLWWRLMVVEGAPLDGQWRSAHCMVSAAEQCHPRVGTVMGGRFAAGLEL